MVWICQSRPSSVFSGELEFALRLFLNFAILSQVLDRFRQLCPCPALPCEVDLVVSGALQGALRPQVVLGLQGGALVADLPSEGGLRIRMSAMVNVYDKDKIKNEYKRNYHQALRLCLYRSSRDTQS